MVASFGKVEDFLYNLGGEVGSETPVSLLLASVALCFMSSVSLLVFSFYPFFTSKTLNKIINLRGNPKSRTFFTFI